MTKYFLAAALALALLDPAAAQSSATRSFYDGRGSFAGAGELGGTMQLFDANGNRIGMAIETGNTTTFYDVDGKQTGKEERHRLDGKLVRVWTDEKYAVEIRYIPGWQLDPKCPQSRWGELDCNGGQGFLLFYGQWKDGVLSGSARLDRDGCDQPYEASGGRAKDGRLVLYPIDDAGKRVINAPCEIRFSIVRRAK
jgi:hypothetical protein